MASQSAGDHVAYILYLIQIVMPMSLLSMFFTQLQKAIGATEQIRAILDAEEEDLYSGTQLESHEANQELAVEGANFAYQEGEPILEERFTEQGGGF